MSHPNQQHPQRHQVSAAPARPRPPWHWPGDRSGFGRRPRRWRTGPGPRFAPDPARAPKVLPLHARPARAVRRPAPRAPQARVAAYQRQRGIPGASQGALFTAGVPEGLTSKQARRVKHKTGALLARGRLE
jgi:hypothetical protein